MGYIGLPTASTLASRGVEVVGVDVNPKVVQAINSGHSHFSEPDLDMLLRAAITLGKLRASSEPESADAFIIAVPTPFNPDKSADTSYVRLATAAIAPVLAKGNVVILESTSPVGTTRAMVEQLVGLRPDLRFPLSRDAVNVDIHIAHCPERVLPGRMVRELIENDRIVGGMTERCAERAEAVYSVFLQGKSFRTDAETAEMVKLVENAFRDVNIAFANELSLICADLGLNVWRVIELANRHPRVSILSPGTGVGGHCIAVDPWFIVGVSPERARLIRTAREVNDGKPHFVADQVIERAERFRNPVIACLGLAFKPDVDDCRESPAMEVVELLAARDNLETILVADPNLAELPINLRGEAKVKFCDMHEAVRRADIVVILQAHSAFKRLGRDDLMRRVVIDPTGLIERI